MNSEKKSVVISSEFIKLDQLLKFAGMFPTGGECKQAVTEGRVRVNGETCLLRGKKMRNGDTAEIDGILLVVEHDG